MKFDDHTIYVTSDYVYNLPNNSSSGSGTIRRKDGFYSFTLADGKFTLGNKSSSIEGSSYDLKSYSFFDEDILYRYYPSFYFGLYTMFDTYGVNDLSKLFTSMTGKSLYVFGLNYGASDGSSIVLVSYFVNRDNTLEKQEVEFSSLGTTTVKELEAEVGK